MFSFKSVAVSGLVAMLNLPTASMAYVGSFSTASELSAGETFEVTFSTQIYISNYVEFGIIWGLTSAEYDCDTCIGTQIGYTDYSDLAAADNTKSNSFVLNATIPSDWPSGSYSLVTGIPYLVGASGETSIKLLSASITIV